MSPALGTLRVVVHRAEGLHIDPGCCPYVHVDLHGQGGPAQAARTPPSVSTTDPWWAASSATFQLQVRESAAVLVCHAYGKHDSDYLGLGEYYGQVEVPIAQFCECYQETEQQRFALTQCTEAGPLMFRERRVAVGTDGALWLSFVFEPTTQKHPVGWVHATVLSCSSLAPPTAAKGLCVDLTVDQVGPVECGSTPYVPPSAGADPVWHTGNEHSFEVRSRRARLVCHVSAMTRRILGKAVKRVFLGEAIVDLSELVASGDSPTTTLMLQLQSQSFNGLNRHGAIPGDATSVAGALVLKVQFAAWVPPPLPLGDLAITMIKAEGLTKADLFSENDTFVELEVEQAKGSHQVSPRRASVRLNCSHWRFDQVQYKRYRTPTVKNTKDPAFNTTVPFMVRIRDAQATIHAHCWDEDWQLPDDYLGTASFRVTQCLQEPNKAHLLELPVTERVGTVGRGAIAKQQAISCCRKPPTLGGKLTVSCVFYPATMDEGDSQVLSINGVKVADPDDDWAVSNHSKKVLCGCSLLWVLAIGFGVFVLVVATSIAAVSGCTDAAAVNFDPTVSISRPGSCVFVFCSTDADCNAPRGTCATAGICACELGFGGQDCSSLQTLFASSVGASLTMSGAVSPSAFQESVASTQAGVSATDVIVDSITQTVALDLAIPIPTNAETRTQLASAVAAAVGIADTAVQVSGVSASSQGRRSLQASAVRATIIVQRDLSEAVANTTQLAHRFSDEAIRVCSACQQFEPSSVIATIDSVVTEFQYRVTPVFASSTLARQFGEALRLNMSDPGTKNTLQARLVQRGGGAVLSTQVGELSVGEALVRVVDGMFAQFSGLLRRIHGELVAAGNFQRSLTFGGWQLQVNAALSGSGSNVPITVDVLTTVQLGELLLDLLNLPPGIENALLPLRAVQVQNMSVTATVGGRPAVELAGSLVVPFSASDSTNSRFRITAELDAASGEWAFSCIFRFADLWAVLAASLQDSVGEFIARVNVPQHGSVLLHKPAAALRTETQMLLGLMPPWDELASLRDAVFAGDDLLSSVAARLDHGLAGTVEYQGRILTLVANSTREEGIKLGAVMSGAPLSLAEAMGSTRAVFSTHLNNGQDAMAMLSAAAIQPLLQLAFGDFHVAVRTHPPTVTVSGNVSWTGAAAEFELCLTKATVTSSWAYALVVGWNDLSFITADLQDYLSGPSLESGAAIMISSETTPIVRVGARTANAFAHFAVPDAGSGSFFSQLPNVPGLPNVATDELAQQFALARTIAAKVIADVQNFTAARLTDGVSGTLNFRGCEFTIFLRASDVAGLTFGAITSSGDSIKLGHALAGAMTTIEQTFGQSGQGDSSGLGGIVLGPLQQMFDVTISDLVLTARTQPPSLHVAGTIIWGGVTCACEFALTKAAGSNEWQWGLVSEWNDVLAIAELVAPAGSPLSEYITNTQVGPLALMVTSTTDPRVHLGVMNSKPGSITSQRISDNLGIALEPQDLARNLLNEGLPAQISDFVQGRLRQGVNGTLKLGSATVSYHLATTSEGLHIITSAAFPPELPQPTFSNVVVGATNLWSSSDDGTALLPPQLRSGFSAFFSEQVSLEHLTLEAWTSPANLQLSGRVRIVDASLAFSFMARQVADEANGWEFELACQTNAISAVWSSIPVATRTALGLATFSPESVPDLANLALRVQFRTTDGSTHFEIGTLNVSTGGITEVHLSRLGAASQGLTAFADGVNVLNVPNLGDMYLNMRDGEVYLSSTQDTLGKSLASVVAAQGNGTELGSTTTGAPAQVSPFLTELSSNTALDSLTAHVWTLLGDDPRATVKMGGVASLANEPVAFAMTVTGNTDTEDEEAVPIDWQLCVAFDVVGFARDHLQALNFLSLQNFNRRMLVDEVAPRGGLQIGVVGGTQILKLGQLPFRGLSGPIQREYWGNVTSFGAGALNPVEPLDFHLGSSAIEVHAFIHAVQSPTDSNLKVQVFSNGNLSLSGLVAATVGFGQCGGSGETALSLYCSLLRAVLDISLGPFEMNAQMASVTPTSDDDLTSYSFDMQVHDIVMWGLPPLNVRLLSIQPAIGPLVWGAQAHWPVINFGGVLRRLDKLKAPVLNTHICDMAFFSPFCEIELYNTQLAYISAADQSMCTELMGLPSVLQPLCSPGLNFKVSMTFPPQFNLAIPGLGQFSTSKLQAVASALLGFELPTVNIPLIMPATPSMASLRPKLPINAILALANAPRSISDIAVGTNPAGGDLLKLHMSAAQFMMDASVAGFFPGFECSLTLDLTGVGSTGASGSNNLATQGRRRSLNTGDSNMEEEEEHGPAALPFWPHRRVLQSSASGPNPSVMTTHTGLLTGIRACGPFAEFNLAMEQPMTWQNPFGIANFNLSLHKLGGGLCIVGGLPVPTSLGLVGGFNWGGVLSGMLFIEIAANNLLTSSQFFYGAMNCQLNPCTAYTLMQEVGVAAVVLNPLQPYLSSMGVNCGSSGGQSPGECVVFLNTNGILPGSPRTIQNFASAQREDLVVPGGFGLHMGTSAVPGFSFLGLSGFAQVNMGLTSGTLFAGFATHIAPPAPLDWLQFGGSSYMHMAYSTSAFNFNVTGRLEWGESTSLATSISLASTFGSGGAAAQFALTTHIILPVVNTECKFDFQIAAQASVAYAGGGIGFGSDFTFADTHFDTAVVGCLWGHLKSTIESFWDTTLSGWLSDAGAWFQGLGRRRRRLQQQGRSTPDGDATAADDGGWDDEWLGGSVPTLAVLEDADCIEYAATPEDGGGILAPNASGRRPGGENLTTATMVCVQHRHKFWRIHAANERLRLLLGLPEIKAALDENTQKEQQQEEDGGAPSSMSVSPSVKVGGAVRLPGGNKTAAVSGKWAAAGAVRSAKRFGINSLGQAVQSLTHTVASAIQGVGDFFSSWSGQILDIQSLTIGGGRSLGHLIRFHSTEIDVALKAKLFPGTNAEVDLSHDIALKFDPAQLFQSVRQGVHDFVTGHLQNSIHLEDLEESLGGRRR